MAAKQTAETEKFAAIAARKDEEKAKGKAIESKKNAVAAQKKEKDAKDEAVIAKEKEEYGAYIARIGLASAKIDENAFDMARALLDDCPQRLRNWEWGRLDAPLPPKRRHDRQSPNASRPSPSRPMANAL